MTNHCPVCREPGRAFFHCEICARIFGCEECDEGNRCNKHRLDLNPFQLGPIKKGGWKLLWQFEQGCKWAEKERWNEAEKRFRVLMSRDPDHTFPRFALARLKAEQGDPEAARDILDGIGPVSELEQRRVTDLIRWCRDQLQGYQ